MKRIVFVALFTAFCATSSFAQTVVGKWKLSSINTEGVNFNVEDPAQMKQELTRQFEASGVKADTAMVNMVFNSMMEALGNMIFEFGSNGKLSVSTTAEGKDKKEVEDYSVDYTTNQITSKSEQKEQQMNFRIEMDKLILVIKEGADKQTEMTLRKIK